MNKIDGRKYPKVHNSNYGELQLQEKNIKPFNGRAERDCTGPHTQIRLNEKICWIVKRFIVLLKHYNYLIVLREVNLF